MNRGVAIAVSRFVEKRRCASLLFFGSETQRSMKKTENNGASCSSCGGASSFNKSYPLAHAPVGILPLTVTSFLLLREEVRTKFKFLFDYFRIA